MTNAARLCPTNREPLSPRPSGGYAQSLWILLLAGTMLLSACGGGGASSDPQPSGTLSGNWQFSIVNTPDLDASSGLQGGFLLQNNGALTGELVYSNTLLGSSQGSCSSGTAPITGTISGQSAVTLTAVAGTQTYALTGTLNSDGSMSGQYTATPGPTVTVNGVTTVCGEGTTGTPLNWKAIPVPPLTGSITGDFHSSSGNNSGLANQDFPLTGTLTQGANIGASNATVTGTLSFIDPTTLLSDYPCISSGTVYVNGQISGNTVVLQLIGTDGSNAGQIGNSANLSGTTPVTFDPTTNGYVLHSIGPKGAPEIGYVVNTKACPAPSNDDGGYICLALNSTTACQQPITLSPAVLSFPPQMLGSTDPSTQTITITNIQPSGSASLTGLTLTWFSISGVFNGPTDFTGVPNFTGADTCVPGEILQTSGGATSFTGSPFDLLPGQSCTVTVSFAPQASCTWLPASQGGTSPAQCPLNLSATLTVDNVPSVDGDCTTAAPAPCYGEFLLPITGSGLSFVQPSTPRLDFGAEAFGEASLPQLLNLTNYGATPVQILPKGTCVTAFGQMLTLPHPLVESSPVAGLQVVSNASQDNPSQPTTIRYSCDTDPSTLVPNFQISSDTCSGTLLEPQASCSLEIGYVPQSANTASGGLDYSLELNTVQCSDPVNDPPSQSNPCELDGGRFPVELTANLGSPLRMSPAAGLNFGNVSVGKSSVPQTVTLVNDPVPNAPTVNFVGKFVVSGNYSETDDCPPSLAPGGSCTLTVTFKPKSVGHNAGTLAINYTAGSSSLQTQPVYLLGTGQ